MHAVLVACALAVDLAPAQAQPHAPLIGDGIFVRTDGTRFVVGAVPFFFVGANVAVMHGARERAAYERTLDAVAADGLSVVRVWALGEAPADSPPWRREYAFRFGPDGWLEDSFVHLDRVLAAARARGLRVIVVLANRWADYGGTSEYMRWAGQPPTARDLGHLELTRFFTCDSCIERYREHVRRIVERTNTVTGVRYRDDPTIFSWELMNESYALGEAAEEALVRFVESTAAFIRARDSSHLVGAGHIGYLRQRERETWLRVQSLPAVSYCDAHAYPEQDPRIRTPADLVHAIDDRVQLAHHVAHKPFIWGEFGVPEGARARARPAALDRFLRASFRDGIAGALVWIYQPWPGEPRPHGIYTDVDGEGARRSLPVRRALARQASLLAASPPTERNRSLADAVGMRPLFDPPVRLRARARPHTGWQSADGARVLAIDPLAFRQARFELAGVFREGAVAQLWGAGAGSVDWAFRSPPRASAPPTRFVIRARISSELPGAGEASVPSDTSEIDVSLDGIALGRVIAPVDDGVGRIVELTSTDPRALAALARPGATHTLRFAARDRPGGGGLAVYGESTGRIPIPAELAAELPGRLELRVEP